MRIPKPPPGEDTARDALTTPKFVQRLSVLVCAGQVRRYAPRCDVELGQQLAPGARLLPNTRVPCARRPGEALRATLRCRGARVPALAGYARRATRKARRRAFAAARSLAGACNC